MIVMDPTAIGNVDRAPSEVKLAEKNAARAAIEARKVVRMKKKTRGRSRTSRRAAKKQANVVTKQKVGTRVVGSEGCQWGGCLCCRLISV